jgi:hypothetical protein
MQADGASRRNIMLGHAVGIPLGQDTAPPGRLPLAAREPTASFRSRR